MANLDRRALNAKGVNDVTAHPDQAAPTQFTYATGVTQYIRGDELSNLPRCRRKQFLANPSYRGQTVQISRMRVSS